MFFMCTHKQQLMPMRFLSSAKIVYIRGTKLLQKSEMRKDIVIELSYRGFSCTSDYS